MHGFFNLFGDIGELVKSFISWLVRIKDVIFGLDDQEIKSIIRELANTKAKKIKFKRGRLEIELDFTNSESSKL